MLHDPSVSGSDLESGTGRGPVERYLPFAVWLAAAMLGWLTLDRGWLPHDAGGLGHASERILTGELPHRDFYDTYTGGLAFLNAVAFKVLGVGVMSMRLVFYASWLLWLPAFHAVARRLAGPWPAAGATLLAAAASLPVYPEGMPSWYNLFLATAGVLALLRHGEDGRRRWLVAAGVAGGVSILFKVIGLYFLAGAGLYVMDRERAEAARTAYVPGAGRAPDLAYRAVVLAGLAVVAAGVGGVVARSGSPLMMAYFALPPWAALGAVAVRLSRPTGTPSGVRFATLLRGSLWLGLGAAVPLALFAVPWVGTGSLEALVQGVLVLPQSRFLNASWSPPPFLAMVSGVVVLGAALLAARLPERGLRAAALAGAALLVALVASSHLDAAYRALWYLVSGSGVVVALAWGHLTAWRPVASSTDVLVLGVFAFHGLVQVPFAAPIYALYAFPLVVLAALGAARRAPAPSRGTVHAVLTALLAFFLLRVDTGFVYHLGFRYRPHNQTEALEVPRAAGLRVSPEEKAEYEALLATVEALDPGPVIYAFPDAPEVYFLTGLANPTPSLFDFLDPDFENRAARVLARLDELGVRVVVLNRRPLFSGPADGAFLGSLQARYPNAREVGRFLVAWREAAP